MPPSSTPFTSSLHHKCLWFFTMNSWEARSTSHSNRSSVNPGWSPGGSQMSPVSNWCSASCTWYYEPELWLYSINWQCGSAVCMSWLHSGTLQLMSSGQESLDGSDDDQDFDDWRSISAWREHEKRGHQKWFHIKPEWINSEHAGQLWFFIMGKKMGCSATSTHSRHTALTFFNL